MSFCLKDFVFISWGFPDSLNDYKDFLKDLPDFPLGAFRILLGTFWDQCFMTIITVWQTTNTNCVTLCHPVSNSGQLCYLCGKHSCPLTPITAAGFVCNKLVHVYLYLSLYIYIHMCFCFLLKLLVFKVHSSSWLTRLQPCTLRSAVSCQNPSSRCFQKQTLPTGFLTPQAAVGVVAWWAATGPAGRKVYN